LGGYQVAILVYADHDSSILPPSAEAAISTASSTRVFFIFDRRG
jgi:hypothetical protein